MSDIKLDPRKLLGFKTVGTGQSTMALRSPKIGTKNCTVVEGADPAGATAIRPTIVTKGA